MSNPIRIFDIQYSNEDRLKIHSYLDQILDEAYLSNHSFCRRLEKELEKRYLRHKFVSCSSGTSALETIFRFLKVKNKAVITQANTFIATGHAIHSAGGIIVPFDLNKEYVASYEDIKLAYNETISSGLEVACICVVNIAGRASEDLFLIKEFCKTKNIFLVEDNSQSIFSKLNDYFLGEIGDFSAYSFQTTKVIAAGEGGLVSCQNEKDLENIRNFISFGKSQSNGLLFENNSGNFKLSELNAAFALMDLERSDERIKKRESLDLIYKSQLNSKICKYLEPPQGNKPSFYKTILMSINNKDRDNIEKSFKNNQVSMTGYVYKYPLNKQPRIIRSSKYIKRFLPNSDAFANLHFTPPNYPELNQDQVKNIVDILNSL
tara:strand:+ start:1082 stop:2212 length:1131 start_codon:yes stop_codon:yes gene_type:complete